MSSDLARACPRRDMLKRIAEEVGTPTFIYDLEKIRSRQRRFAKAFAEVDHLVAYAVKANGNLAVINALSELGAGADIVSGGELLRATAAGIPSSRIVFSGVGKTHSELEEAVRSGIYQINLESIEEAEELSAIAASVGRPVPVALRVTPDVAAAGANPKISTGSTTTKFGVAADEAVEAFEAIAEMPLLELQGLAMHIGSQMMDLSPLRAALTRLDTLIATLRGRGWRLRTISVGGGLAIRYRKDLISPELKDYAALVLPFAKRWDAKLILEPGRWLVGEAGVLLTRVVRVKKARDRAFVVLDAGMNDLPRPSLYDAWHDIRHLDWPERESRQIYDVVGPLCETGDLFGRGRSLPETQPGDLILIGDAGAYCSSMAGNYNSRRLTAEVVIDAGRWSVARSRQTYDDLLALERLPLEA